MAPNLFSLTMLLSSPIGQFAADLNSLSKRTTSVSHSMAKTQESKNVSR